MPFNYWPLVKGLLGVTAVATPTGLFIDKMLDSEKKQERVSELEGANQTLISMNNLWDQNNPLINLSNCIKHEEQKVTEQNQQVTIPAYLECFKRAIKDKDDKYTNWDIILTPSSEDGSEAEEKLKTITTSEKK